MINSKNVKVKDLVKIYPGNNGKQVRAVDNVSIDINPGEFVTLLGPSGCGKTTILRMIAGFEMPTNGQIYIGDECVTNLTPDKRDTSMVFQSYALFPHLTVYENVAYGLRIKKLKEESIKQKVEEMLALVGLGDLDSRYPSQLSGGQQQRIALARSLVMEPSVLLFDEPLSNLDAKLRVHMRSEIRKIQRKVGITTIYVTHDQAEAMSMSDKVILMNKGNIEQIGTPQDIYQKPATQFVADFIGLANVLDGEVVGQNPDGVLVNFIGKEFKIKTDFVICDHDKIKVIIRPETLKILQNGEIAAKVESSIFMGAYQDYRINVGGQSLMVIDYNPSGKKTFNANDIVYLYIDENSIHVVKH